MLKHTAMFKVTTAFRGISVGEFFCASFTPKAKEWYWSDGNNNSYCIPSWKMKKYFYLTKRSFTMVCKCGRKSLQFDHEEYICLPCIWEVNGV